MNTCLRWQKNMVRLKIVEAAAEDGVIPEFVPKKPSLKMTKRNKLLIKSGVVPSRKVV